MPKFNVWVDPEERPKDLSEEARRRGVTAKVSSRMSSTGCTASSKPRSRRRRPPHHSVLVYVSVR